MMFQNLPPKISGMKSHVFEEIKMGTLKGIFTSTWFRKLRISTSGLFRVNDIPGEKYHNVGNHLKGNVHKKWQI